MSSWLEDWQQRPAARLVYVRRDSEGRWFWYHNLCHAAAAGIGAWRDAVVEAAQHAKHDVHNWPGTPFFGHIDADPDTNRERASWLCPDCKQYCASHNPCDCCGDEEWP